MLDVTRPNQNTIALGMGTLTRNEQLAEYYLRAAGVAAVWIDPDGCIGAQENATFSLPDGRLAFCCPRGAHFVLAYRLQLWKQDEVWVAVPAIVEKLQGLAELGGVGLTPHPLAIERALQAVARVNQALDGMKATGHLKDLNAAFKASRKVDPSLRYHDFLHTHKAGMLEAIAMGKELPEK